jgi:hypothetical protein
LSNGLQAAWLDLVTVGAGLLWIRCEAPGRDRWMTVGFVFTLTYSWLQRLGLDPFVWSDPNLSRLRTIAVLANPNYLAMYLACLCPWAWSFLYRRGPAGWMAGLFCLVSLLLVATRGSNLVLTGVVVLVTLWVLHGRAGEDQVQEHTCGPSFNQARHHLGIDATGKRPALLHQLERA